MGIITSFPLNCVLHSVPLSVGVYEMPCFLGCFGFFVGLFLSGIPFTLCSKEHKGSFKTSQNLSNMEIIPYPPPP